MKKLFTHLFKNFLRIFKRKFRIIYINRNQFYKYGYFSKIISLQNLNSKYRKPTL